MAFSPSPKPKRGFASMDPEKVREIARMGGRAIAPEKRSFSADRGLARAAGRKGGKRSQAARIAASQHD